MAFDVEGELVEDINGKYLWRTADGREVPVELMADNHIRNCSLFLMGMGYRKCVANQVQAVAWLTVFRREWERRMFARAEARRQREEEAAYHEQKELEESQPHGRKQLR